MKILGLIPARGGSKGVPRKNIKLLGNKPLIAYSIESALKSNQFSEVIVSTEDEEIAEVAKKFGAKVSFLRPKELSSDTAKSIDVVFHAIDTLEAQGEFYDAICLLQPTNPFRSVKLITEAIQKFEKEQPDTLLSVLPVPLEYNPHWTFEVNMEGYLKIATGETELISRRQELPISYYRDGSIYLVSIKTIKNNHSFYGEQISYIEADKRWHVNIDTIEDWKLAETLVDKFNNE